jgi:hypothetical protein
MSTAQRGVVAELQAALPAGGLFQGKKWRWSDRSLQLDATDLKILESLGKKLAAFLKASDRLYRASISGEAPRCK